LLLSIEYIKTINFTISIKIFNLTARVGNRHCQQATAHRRDDCPSHPMPGEAPTMTPFKAYWHDIETTLEHVLADFAQMGA
jgi:hypothetical protein